MFAILCSRDLDRGIQNLRNKRNLQYIDVGLNVNVLTILTIVFNDYIPQTLLNTTMKLIYRQINLKYASLRKKCTTSLRRCFLTADPRQNYGQRKRINLNVICYLNLHLYSNIENSEFKVKWIKYLSVISTGSQRI